MTKRDGETTSPTLLRRVADWRDDPAWLEFVARYEPLLRRWCGRYRLDASASDELCQQVWIELARRMRSFRYDPGLTFRGWLWRLFHCRALDFLKRRKAEQVLPLAEALDASCQVEPAADLDVEDPRSGVPERTLLLLRLAGEAQERVRARVDPETWSAFWRVAIEGSSVRETATEMGKTYAAVFAACQRVDRKLADEGRRLLAERSRAG